MSICACQGRAFDESQQVGQPLVGDRMELRVALGIGHAGLKRRDRGVDLALLGDRGDPHRDLDGSVSASKCWRGRPDRNAPDQSQAINSGIEAETFERARPEHSGDVLAVRGGPER